jgi:hypothetical protein
MTVKKCTAQKKIIEKQMLATSTPAHSRGNIQQPIRHTLGGFATSQRPSD